MKRIFGTLGQDEPDGAFAALLKDGSVLAWGHLKCTPVDVDWSGDTWIGACFTLFHIICDPECMAMKRVDGIVGGGSIPADVQIQLDSCGVTEIFSAQFAFVALCTDGSVFAWGDVTGLCVSNIGML